MLRMKRFTDTAKWDKGWFFSLSPEAKLLWIFLCDHADNAGVVDFLPQIAANKTGLKVENCTLKPFGNKITRSPSGKYWLPGFIEFQFGRVGGKSLIHQAVTTLVAKRIRDGDIPCSSLEQAMGIPAPSLKEKEKEKDKEKRGFQGGLPASLNEPDFAVLWNEWLLDRRARGKPVTDRAARLQLQKLESFGLAKAKASLRQSIQNGWQGLFEPRDFNATNSTNGHQRRKTVDLNAGTLNDPSQYENFHSNV